MWRILLALLAIALVVWYTAVINAWPGRCPACRRVNVCRRTRVGAWRREPDDEGTIRRAWAEVDCRRCGRRYWLVWDDFAGRQATLAPPGGAADRGAR